MKTLIHTNMKKRITQILMLNMLCAVTSVSVFTKAQEQGQNEQQPEQTVYVTSIRSDINRGQKNAYEHSVTHVFWVESTEPVLNLSCVVSDLMLMKKGRNSKGLEVDPLEINTVKGCRIEVPGAVSTIDAAHSRIARFKGEVKEERVSDYVTFETTDGSSAFAQDVYVTLYWKQRSTMQMSGEYQGTVKLLAEIPDETTKPK